MLHTADLAVEPDDRLRQGEHPSRPEPADFHHDPARRQQQGARGDPEQRRDAEKGDVEQERPQPAHRSWLTMARPRPVLRTTAPDGAGSGQYARRQSWRSRGRWTREMNGFFALRGANSSRPASSRSRPPVTTTIASVVPDGSARMKRLLRTNQARPAPHSRKIAAATFASRRPKRRSRAMPRSGHMGQPAQYHDPRRNHRNQPDSH